MQGRLDSTAVIFGDFRFKDIEQELIDLQELFKDLLVFANFSRNPILTGIPFENPIAIELFSPNKQLIIQIANNRINILKNTQFDDTGKKTEYNDKEFLETAQDIQKRLLKHYKVTGSRIAYIINFCREDSEEVKNKLLNDHLYKYSESFEWGARNAVRENFSINGKEEVINIVTSINFYPENLKITIGSNTIEIGGVMYNLDINTVPENIQTRVDENFISEFYKKALELSNKIEGGYLW